MENGQKIGWSKNGLVKKWIGQKMDWSKNRSDRRVIASSWLPFLTNPFFDPYPCRENRGLDYQKDGGVAKSRSALAEVDGDLAGQAAFGGLFVL